MLSGVTNARVAAPLLRSKRFRRHAFVCTVPKST